MPSTPTATLSIPDLRATITGRVIAPDDEGYDEARTVVLGGIDRRPAGHRPRRRCRRRRARDLARA